MLLQARIFAASLILFSMAVSSCKLEGEGNSLQVLGANDRVRLPKGVPAHLQNTAWKASAGSCNYYMAFSLTNRMDLVACGPQISYSEYEAGSLKTEPSGSDDQEINSASRADVYRISSESLVATSCNKSNALVSEGHLFYSELLQGLKTSEQETLATWTRKRSKQVLYTAVDLETVNAMKSSTTSNVGCFSEAGFTASTEQ